MFSSKVRNRVEHIKVQCTPSVGSWFT